MRKPTQKRAARPGRHGRDDQGFTIVELVIAIAILAIALLGIVSLYIHTVALSEMNREIQTASFAAQQKLEEVRGIPFDDIQLNYPPGKVVRFNVNGLPPVPPEPTNASVMVDYTNPGLLTVTVSVRWNGIRGSTTIDPVSTMITR